MLQILLIRHGIAEDLVPGIHDHERALTPEGWRKTRAAMSGLVRRGYLPQMILSSPYRRAMETAQCLQEACNGLSESLPATETWDGLVPEGDPAAINMRLRALAAEGLIYTIALVSHQPLCSELILHLTGRLVDAKRASCAVMRLNQGICSLTGQFTASELQ